MRNKRSITTLLVLILSLVPFLLLPVHADYGWDTNTQVILSQRSEQGPALAYNSITGKVFMAWIGNNCCTFNLNFISSSDGGLTWGSVITTGLSDAGAASCTMGLDMVFDPDNGNMYIAYVANSGCGSKGNTNYLYVFHTADGTSLSNLSVLLTSSSFISSPSITYSSASKQFVVSSSSEIFTSSDGINWVASQQVVVGSGIISAAYSEIRFINSYYWLSYSDTSNYIHIAQSSDLNTWSLWSNVGTQTYLRPRLSYYPPQSQYHLDWQGTNFCGTSCGGINDMPSSNAQTWGSKNVFQSTQQEPVLAYDPSTQSLLMAWTGTDCCFGGSLNVMQYHNIATSGGGGGSVALGTEILTPNGNVAVQNLNVGDTVVSIDPFTQQLYHSTITSINIVTVGNMLIFHTATGQPLRVDINPRLRFNAIHNDQLGLWSTVLLVPGDSLYQFGYGWTTITGIDRIYGGQHTYYDLHLDPLHDYIASGYADCPCKT